MKSDDVDELEVWLAINIEEFDPRDYYPLVDLIMQADDKLDPSLNSYQQL